MMTVVGTPHRSILEDNVTGTPRMLDAIADDDKTIPGRL